MEQEHRPTAAVVFHMNRNAVDLHHFAFPLLLCHHVEQLLTRRPGRRHRLVGPGDLHDTVDHSRSCHDPLWQREHRPELGGNSEEVGVVHRRDEKRLGDARRPVRRRRFRPTLDYCVEPGDPRPIDLDRVAVPGRHSRLGHEVLCEREREWVAQVLSYDLCRAEGVHKSHGDPAPERRVGAGPRIAYTDDPCRNRNAVHDETPVTVDGAAHGEHVGDRLTVEAVCVQRTCGDKSRPYGTIQYGTVLFGLGFPPQYSVSTRSPFYLRTIYQGRNLATWQAWR